jgi:hypothetical protein
MKIYEGYVTLANGRVQLMQVSAPDSLSARTMLQAMGSCSGVAEKPQPAGL